MYHYLLVTLAICDYLFHKSKVAAILSFVYWLLANFRLCFRLGKLTLIYYHNLNFCNIPGASLLTATVQDFPPFYRRLEPSLSSN